MKQLFNDNVVPLVEHMDELKRMTNCEFLNHIQECEQCMIAQRDQQEIEREMQTL